MIFFRRNQYNKLRKIDKPKHWFNSIQNFFREWRFFRSNCSIASVPWCKHSLPMLSTSKLFIWTQNIAPELKIFYVEMIIFLISEAIQLAFLKCKQTLCGHAVSPTACLVMFFVLFTNCAPTKCLFRFIIFLCKFSRLTLSKSSTIAHLFLMSHAWRLGDVKWLSFEKK